MSSLPSLSAVLYTAYVIALTLPAARSGLGARERFSYVLGVMAAAVVPMSGAPAVLSPTYGFYPFVILAIFAGGRGMARYAAACLLGGVAAISAAAARSFGTPGAIFSIESTASLVRLAASGAPGEICAAAAGCAALTILAMVCLALSPHTYGTSSAMFACASFAARIMLPVDTANMFHIAPPTSNVLDFAAIQVAALAIYLGIRGGQRTRARQSGSVESERRTSDPGRDL